MPAEEGKTAVAPSGAAATKKAVDQNSVVKVKNISSRLVNTSQGSIGPGKSGKATIAELRQLHKFLEKA